MSIDFLALKKNLKKDFSSFPQHRLAILGDSSTQIFNQAIRASGYEFGLNFSIYESDYGQIEQEILNPRSQLYAFSPNYIVIFFSAEKLRDAFYSTTYADRIHFSDKKVAEIELLIDAIKSNQTNSEIFLLNFVESFDEIFGNFAVKFPSSFTFQLRKLNMALMSCASNRNDLYISDVAGLHNRVGHSHAFDSKLFVNADIIFSLDFTASLAKNLCETIVALTGRIKKCLILDLDNTLWGGIIGDDGLENIQIGDLGIGKAFTRFQKWVKELKERGIILAICSKNTEEIAKEPFKVHSDMQLRLEDIAIFVANWESKAANIRYIQSVLNIGFDSMVFVDDNKFERELVRNELPMVEIPEMPSDPSDYVDFLAALNLFETVTFSDEDSVRTRQYQEEASRNNLKSSLTSEGEYLNSLNMLAVVEPFTKFTIPRVAQLTQRSNQFNLRTVRYTENEVEDIAADETYLTLSFHLKDRFGDHGLVAAVILKKNPQHLFIDTWVMSCRVLKRGMEEFIINTIMQTAAELNVVEVLGQYLPTPKNGIVSNLFANLGFQKVADNLWMMKHVIFKPLDTYIKSR